MKRSFISLAAIVAIGCASTAPSAAGHPASRDSISEAQLASFGGQTVHYAIQRLRPEFLRTRGPSSITRDGPGVVVYLGTTRMGGVASLAQIPASDIRTIQYLNPSDATRRFGLDHSDGAILLVPK